MMLFHPRHCAFVPGKQHRRGEVDYRNATLHGKNQVSECSGLDTNN